jgi:hypothetical protein
MFNVVVQETTSTITGFVAVTRRQGYCNALNTGMISPDIFQHPKMQGNQLRQSLHSIILTQHHPYHVGGTIQRGIVRFQTFPTSRPKEQTPSIRRCRRRIAQKNPRATAIRRFIATNKRQLQTQAGLSITFQLRSHCKGKQSSSKQQQTYQQCFFTLVQSSPTQRSQTNSPFFVAKAHMKAKHARTLRHSTFSNFHKF